LGINISAIRDALSAKYLQGKKYYWRKGEPQTSIIVPKIKTDKAVEKLSLDGKVLETFQSIGAAAMAMGGKSGPSIGRACNGIYELAKGYRWRFVNEDAKGAPRTNNAPIKRQIKTVCLYDLDGIFVSRYESLTEAAKSLNIHVTSAGRALNSESVTAKERRHINSDNLSLFFSIFTSL